MGTGADPDSSQTCSFKGLLETQINVLEYGEAELDAPERGLGYGEADMLDPLELQPRRYCEGQEHRPVHMERAR